MRQCAPHSRRTCAQFQPLSLHHSGETLSRLKKSVSVVHRYFWEEHMQRPKHAIINSQDTMSPRRMASLGFVAALHVVVIWALISGLAQRIVKIIPPELQATVIDQPTTPPKEMVIPKPQMVEPPAPTTVTPPDIVIDNNTPPPIATTVAPTAP